MTAIVTIRSTPSSYSHPTESEPGLSAATCVIQTDLITNSITYNWLIPFLFFSFLVFTWAMGEGKGGGHNTIKEKKNKITMKMHLLFITSTNVNWRNLITQKKKKINGICITHQSEKRRTHKFCKKHNPTHDFRGVGEKKQNKKCSNLTLSQLDKSQHTTFVLPPPSLQHSA